MSEGLLHQKIAVWYFDNTAGNANFDDLLKVLDKAKKDFTFNENDEMWKQFLSAESGESGDYPELSDFVFWLVDETKKLIKAKKKWFGDGNGKRRGGKIGMSEGLLYKKIREMRPPVEEVFLNEPNEEIFTQDTVQKVLDEAFKELDVKLKLVTENEELHPAAVHEALVNVYSEWGVKWFVGGRKGKEENENE